MLQHNKIVSIHAESYSIAQNFSTTPSLTADNALVKALDFVKAKKYAWESLAEDKSKVAGDPVVLQKLGLVLCN